MSKLVLGDSQTFLELNCLIKLIMTYKDFLYRVAIQSTLSRFVLFQHSLEIGIKILNMTFEKTNVKYVYITDTIKIL